VSCEKSFQNGYFGQVTLKAIFKSPGIVSHLSNRFLQMAEFLKQFPALAALEMFNEPAFAETEDPEFGRIIAQVRHALYVSDPTLRKVSIYSGVAWWDEKIANGLLASGDLPTEPYATVHYYRKAGIDVGDVTAEIAKDVADVRKLAPGKQVIVAEVGSEAPIFDLDEHAKFLNALMAACGFGVHMQTTQSPNLTSDGSSLPPPFRVVLSGTISLRLDTKLCTEPRLASSSQIKIRVMITRSLLRSLNSQVITSTLRGGCGGLSASAPSALSAYRAPVFC
jgi:hypothetical protein